MLSRKTTKTLAELFHQVFGWYGPVLDPYVDILSRETTHYHLNKQGLYDFLYEHDYDAWFLNAVKDLPELAERGLKEFIMRLHTGETVAPATPEWSWEQRRKLGQRLLRDLSEDILVWANTPGTQVRDAASKVLPQLASQLELDGYIFRDGRLYYTEAAVLDTEHEQGILERLIQDLKLDKQQVMKHHLELSETHYVDGKWDDSIANSRKLLESVLQEIAARHHLFKTGQRIDQSAYSRPYGVRDYLQAEGLIEPKEKEAITEVYGLLSETGGHPYIAAKDQARLMRHLALTFAQFALLRLQGALATP